MKQTLHKLRDLLELPTMVVDEKLIVSLPANDHYRYNVTLVITLDEKSGKLSVFGCSPELKASGARAADALIFCNNYNKQHSFLSVCYDTEDKDFNTFWSLMVHNVSDEYIKDTINLIVTFNLLFFVEAGKVF